MNISNYYKGANIKPKKTFFLIKFFKKIKSKLILIAIKKAIK